MIKAKIKCLLSGFPRTFRAVRRIYRALLPVTFPRPNEGIISDLTNIFSGRHDLFFLQIGANDGISTDPIREIIIADKTWRGIFVEPVPHIFRRLCENYSSESRFVFENAAISIASGRIPFYYISDEAKSNLGDKLPEYYAQIASLDRNHLVKYTGQYIEPFIKEIPVKCLTVRELLEKHSVQRIDLIDIDTEGHDYKVLSQLDLTRYHPYAIVYEHKLLSDEEQSAAFTMLKGYGYILKSYSDDTIAISPEAAACAGHYTQNIRST